MLTPRTWLFVCSALASVASVAHTLLDPAGWQRRSALAGDLLRRTDENVALEEQTAHLRSQIAALGGRAEAQEHIVRDELGWVRPGDWVIYFGD